MDNPPDKNQVIDKLKIERAQFDAALAQMSEAQMVEAAVQDDWTVKDIIAHSTAWERELLTWLAQAARGEFPSVPAPGGWHPYMDDFNARAFSENQNRPVADILADSRQVFAQVMAALHALPDDPDDTYWSVWYEGKPPWGLIATYHEHYRDHRQPIEAWLNRQDHK